MADCLKHGWRSPQSDCPTCAASKKPRIAEFLKEFESQQKALEFLRMENKLLKNKLEIEKENRVWWKKALGIK